MSDMLQLVVAIGKTQWATLRRYHHLSANDLDDKLKHVGHSQPVSKMMRTLLQGWTLPFAALVNVLK